MRPRRKPAGTWREADGIDEKVLRHRLARGKSAMAASTLLDKIFGLVFFTTLPDAAASLLLPSAARSKRSHASGCNSMPSVF